MEAIQQRTLIFMKCKVQVKTNISRSGVPIEPIIGMAMAGVIVLVVGVALIWYFKRKKPPEQPVDVPPPSPRPSPRPSPPPSPPPPLDSSPPSASQAPPDSGPLLTDSPGDTQGHTPPIGGTNSAHSQIEKGSFLPHVWPRLAFGFGCELEIQVGFGF